MTELYTLADAKRQHPEWFSPGAMRFFNGELHESFPTPTGVYIVNSVRYDDDHPRHYVVTRFSPTDCDTLGPIAVDAPTEREPVIAAAKNLAELEAAGWIRERVGAHGEYTPCSACLADGELAPGWATFQLAAELDPVPAESRLWVDLCSRHMSEDIVQTVKS